MPSRWPRTRPIGTASGPPVSPIRVASATRSAATWAIRAAGAPRGDPGGKALPLARGCLPRSVCRAAARDGAAVGSREPLLGFEEAEVAADRRLRDAEALREGAHGDGAVARKALHDRVQSVGSAHGSMIAF